MKKILFLSLNFLVVCFNSGTAQITEIGTFFSVGSVSVFSEYSHGGESRTFNTAGIIDVPFAIKSLKVGGGYEVVFPEGAEFPSPVLITKDYSFVLNQDCKQIVITATPYTQPLHLELYLRDVFTNIHNNDCKRMFGYVNMLLLLPNGFEYPLGADNPNSSFFRETAELSILNWQPGDAKYVTQGNSTPNLLNIPIDLRRFRIDESLLPTSHLAFYTKLGSAHKGCDLCSDYTPNIGMPEIQKTVSFPLSTIKSYPYDFPVLDCGPYPANDGRHSFKVAIWKR